LARETRAAASTERIANKFGIEGGFPKPTLSFTAGRLPELLLMNICKVPSEPIRLSFQVSRDAHCSSPKSATQPK
jgi:hypothetical protein